jgi:ankyrin repeat protein
VATALDKAVDAGNLPEVQRLVAAGADVNVEGGKYSTSPLYEAVTGRHKDIAEFLIANKANVKEDHRNLLYMVSSTGDADWVRLLVANGADVNAEGVCQTGPPDDMEVAPATGWFEDSHGWTATPLAIASAWGHKSVVEALLDGGAGIDFKTKSGRTALMWASYYGQLGTVQTLLARGANLNIALEHTVSVSFIQFANGAMAYKGPTYTDEQFSALAQSSPGAILHRAGVEKETALSLATSEGHADVRDALIKAGAK